MNALRSGYEWPAARFPVSRMGSEIPSVFRAGSISSPGTCSCRSGSSESSKKPHLADNRCGNHRPRNREFRRWTLERKQSDNRHPRTCRQYSSSARRTAWHSPPRCSDSSGSRHQCCTSGGTPHHNSRACRWLHMRNLACNPRWCNRGCTGRRTRSWCYKNFRNRHCILHRWNN
jgi:hypothetical protein